MLSSVYRGYLMHFSTQGRKKKQQQQPKKISYVFPKKVFIIFQVMELSGHDVKKGLIFSKKKVFLMFSEVELSGPKIKKF